MDSNQYLNRFEIEERIKAKLPLHLQEKYKKLRAKSRANVKESERLKQTAKRIEHWEQISDRFLNTTLKQLLDNTMNTGNNDSDSLTQYITENKIIEETTSSNKTNMSENNKINIGQEIASAISDALSTFMEQQKQMYSNTNKDFLPKPKFYKGERDPQTVDLWIKSIEDYSDLKGYDNKKTYTLGKTLLDTDAKTWLYIIEQDNIVPLDDWIKLKRLLIQTFKPANSSIILRDKLHLLNQTSGISNYIREFVQLKISITNLSNEEVVSQFVRGLKDFDLRLKIHRLYRGDTYAPLNEAINEAYLHESSAQAVVNYLPNNKLAVEKSETMIDDPMDLSAALHKILAIVSPGYTNRQHKYYSNQFRPRGNTNNYRRRCNYRGRNDISRRKQCFACKGYGHVQMQCPNYKKQQKVYYLDDDKHTDDNNDKSYNDNSSNNKYKHNKNEQTSYEHYSDTSPSLLYSVLPSSSSYIQPLTITKDIL